MAENPGNPTRRMMYEAAFMNLSNGIVSPVDKDILAYAPLPDSVTDSYTTREVDPLQTMNLANNALILWVDEAKKASYFTAHFVTLSRMIMNGVATMARGLVTLHIQGEDLDRAPLSIQDLIGISSYQFRKSYLGVLQTVKSHPEISERLLMNQLRWTDTLIRLFKTKEKLAEKVSMPQASGLPKQDKKELAADADSMDPLTSFGFSDDGLSSFAALSEYGSYGAIQAFGPLQTEKKNRRNSKNHVPELPEEAAADVLNLKADSDGSSGNVLPEPSENAETENTGRIPNDGSQNSGDEAEGSGPDQARETMEPVKTDDPQQPLDENAESREPLSAGGNNTDASDRSDNTDTAAREEIKEGSPVSLSQSPPAGKNIPDHPPEYARILYRVACRSSGNKDGALKFTLNEIRQLLADPEFCMYETKMAADFRIILDSLRC